MGIGTILAKMAPQLLTMLAGSALGGGGSAPSSSTETRSTRTPEQEALMKELLGFLGQYSQDSGLGNLESTSLAGLEKFAEEGAAGGSQLYKSGSDAIQNILGQGQDDFSQYYQTNIQEPLLKGFEEDVMPRISRRFGPSGLFGSDRKEADARARDDLLSALTRGKAETVLGARKQNLQALGLIPGFEGTRTQIGLNAATAGLEERRKRMAQILQSLSIQPVENITTVTGGQASGGAGFLSAIAPAIGKSFLSTKKTT